jgi:hypothetical protein
MQLGRQAAGSTPASAGFATARVAPNRRPHATDTDSLR